jgi:hypothetical protein
MESSMTGHNKRCHEDLTADMQMESLPLPNMSDTQCYIYKSVIRISFDKLPSQVEQAAQVCSAVYIFNMALAHHREGLRQNQKCSERAISLYNMVIRLLRFSNLRGPAGVVKLAAINNLSQLRYDQGNYDLAREGLNHLSSIVQARSASLLQLSDTELNGVIMNLAFLKPPRVAAAA